MTFEEERRNNTETERCGDEKKGLGSKEYVHVQRG
jgi:hypothetical protein